MSAENRISDLLLHLVVSCNRLADLRKDTSHSAFVTNYRVSELALRFIETLGETVRRIDRLDGHLLDQNDLAVARQIVGMRNRIAHQYDGVDLELVWEVIVDYAPRLRQVVIPVLLRFDPDADLDSLHF